MILTCPRATAPNTISSGPSHSTHLVSPIPKAALADTSGMSVMLKVWVHCYLRTQPAKKSPSTPTSPTSPGSRTEPFPSLLFLHDDRFAEIFSTSRHRDVNKCQIDSTILCDSCSRCACWIGQQEREMKTHLARSFSTADVWCGGAPRRECKEDDEKHHAVLAVDGRMGSDSPLSWCAVSTMCPVCRGT